MNVVRTVLSCPNYPWRVFAFLLILHNKGVSEAGDTALASKTEWRGVWGIKRPFGWLWPQIRLRNLQADRFTDLSPFYMG